MVGESAIPQQNSLTSVFGITHGEEELADSIPAVIRTKYFLACYEAYIFRKFDQARENADKFFSFNALNTSGVVMYCRIL